MVRVIQKQNILLIYSKYFLFLEWKLEKSDLKHGNELRSPEFNVGVEGKNSSIEIYIRNDGVTSFYLHNPQPLADGYYVLTILDKYKSLIESNNDSTVNFKALDKIYMLGQYGRLPSSTEYPIIVICTVKSSVNDHFSVSDIKSDIKDRVRMNEISSDWKNVLEQELNTDIELITDGKSIKAHKIVLQARSPVFRKMFDHDSSEASKNTVDISDIGSTTMKRLVNFLYTGIMDKCDFDEAMELYYAADKYEVLSLRDDCKVELLNHLVVENACRLFTLANRHNDRSLKEEVAQFVSSNYVPILRTESMNEISKEDILELMRLSTAGMVK